MKILNAFIFSFFLTLAGFTHAEVVNKKEQYPIAIAKPVKEIKVINQVIDTHQTLTCQEAFEASIFDYYVIEHSLRRGKVYITDSLLANGVESEYKVVWKTLFDKLIEKYEIKDCVLATPEKYK